MKFLTDENISISVFKAVRNLNYDVKDVKEEKLYQTPDINLLKIASEEKRIIITHDKDFVNIAEFTNIQHEGIILIRLRRPKDVENVLLRFLNSNFIHKIENCLVIIGENNFEIYRR